MTVEDFQALVRYTTDAIDGDGGAGEFMALHDQRAVYVAPTLAGMVALNGSLDPYGGEVVATALEHRDAVRQLRPVR